MVNLTFAQQAKKPPSGKRSISKKEALSLIRSARSGFYYDHEDFWTELFSKLDLPNNFDLRKSGPTGRFFRDMLVAFPAAAKVDVQDVVRCISRLGYSDSRSILSLLLQLHKNEKDAKIGPRERQAILDRLKAQMFVHTFDESQISSMDDQTQYNMFMTYLSGSARLQDVLDARALFYACARLPEALKSHHAENIERMGRFFAQIEDPELLARVFYAMGFLEKNGMDSEKARDVIFELASATASIIAKVHGIPEPEIDRQEYADWGGAVCVFGAANTLQSKIQYKLRGRHGAHDVVFSTFHEVAGHADELVQARRSHKKAWLMLDEATRQAYPLLDPKTPLSGGALMLAFNNAVNHGNGHYFRPEANETHYGSQLSEKNACYVESKAGWFFMEAMQRLGEALETLGRPYFPLRLAVSKGGLSCKKLAEELEDGDLKNYLIESAERLSVLKSRLDNPDLKCSEDPGFRVACLELLEEIRKCTEGAHSCPFSDRFSVNINECIGFINLGGYPPERLRLLADQIKRLEIHAAFESDDKMLVPACKAA